MSNEIEITQRMVINAHKLFSFVPQTVIRRALEAVLNPEESLCSECNHPLSSHTHASDMCPSYKATYWTPKA